jgi:hypothetical protein
MLITEPLDIANIIDVPVDLSTLFDYLMDSGTNADNADLRKAVSGHGTARTPRVLSIVSAWSYKSNFWLHLYETAVYRADVRTHIRVGRRELAKE